MQLLNLQVDPATGDAAAATKHSFCTTFYRPAAEAERQD